MAAYTPLMVSLMTTTAKVFVAHVDQLDFILTHLICYEVLLCASCLRIHPASDTRLDGRLSYSRHSVIIIVSFVSVLASQFFLQ